MWTYEKKLQHPVKIKCPNPAIAKVVITQVGGPDGELAASMRYLSQRYTMPYKEAVGVLNDIGISFTKLHTIFTVVFIRILAVLLALWQTI